MQMILRDQRRLITVIILLLIAGLASAQDTAYAKHPVRNIIWFTPASATTINGLAVGAQAFNLNDQTLTINGVNADMGWAAFMSMGYILDAYIHPARRSFYKNDSIEAPGTIIHGCSFSFGGELGITIKGLAISGISTLASEVEGVSITGAFSFCGSFKGLLVGGITNMAIKGTGLQIGLFNRCKNLKGVQFGLWNKSGKRGLPLINWGI